MLSTGEKIRCYFDRIPLKWDALYSGESTVSQVFNGLFRKAIFERFRLTFIHCGDISGALVLDIGSGTGQYTVQFALRGAQRVIGIDFSPLMIDFARGLAQEKGVSSLCELRCEEFTAASLSQKFDIVVAVGFFDYVDLAGPVLKKIAGLTAGRFLASFPCSGPLWRVQRAVRYGWLKGCKIHEYTPRILAEMYEEAGFKHYRVIPMTRGLFVVAGNDNGP
jgi:SAM-dependent methyltransferase